MIDITKAEFEEVGFFDDHPTDDTIVNVPDKLDPKEVSNTDYSQTHLTDDNAQFNGAWSVYPYSKFGNNIVSSIERSLFDLKKNGLSDGVPNEKEKCRQCTGVVGFQIGFGTMNDDPRRADCWISHRNESKSPSGSNGHCRPRNLCNRFIYDNPPWK